jgi:hypothetical protein
MIGINTFSMFNLSKIEVVVPSSPFLVVQTLGHRWPSPYDKIHIHSCPHHSLPVINYTLSLPPAIIIDIKREVSLRLFLIHKIKFMMYLRGRKAVVNVWIQWS